MNNKNKVLEQLEVAIYILRKEVSDHIFHDPSFDDDYEDYRHVYKKLIDLKNLIARDLQAKVSPC